MQQRYDTLKNPLFEILYFMQSYEANGLDDPAFRTMAKNLQTNFNKLYLTVDQIMKAPTSEVTFAKSSLRQVQLIEYCFLKISTIWDLSYQLSEYLLQLGKTSREKRIGKFKNLGRRFEAHKKEFDFLGLDWYHEVNRIRNRIVHGGVNIVPFYLKESEELMFNAYDLHLNSVIPHCSVYSAADGLKVSAARYFVYNTGILYQYLYDFFEFVLRELRPTIDPTISLEPFIEETLRSHGEYWRFESLEEYNRWALQKKNLPLASVRDEYIRTRFKLMRFSDEPESSEYKKKMAMSIGQKHGMEMLWLDECRLRVKMAGQSHETYGPMLEELVKFRLGLANSEPNRDEQHWILTFQM